MHVKLKKAITDSNVCYEFPLLQGHPVNEDHVQEPNDCPLMIL